MFNNDKFMAEALKIYGHHQYKDCFSKTYLYCLWASPITQTIGAALASYYLYRHIGLSLLPSGHQYQVPVAMGAVLFSLVSLELSKRVCVSWTFRYIFKRILLFRPIRWPYLLGGAAVLCMGLSVFTSALGAQLYAANLKDTTPRIEAEYKQKRDAVKASFERDITQKKAIIYALEKRGRNRRWGLTDNETMSLSLAYDAIEKLTLQKTEAIEQLNAQENRVVQKARKKLDTSLVPVVAFALFLEALTLSCLGYSEYFKARIFKENLPVENRCKRISLKYPKLTKDLVKRKRSRRPISVKELSHIHGVGQSTIHRLKQELSL